MKKMIHVYLPAILMILALAALALANGAEIIWP